MITPLLVPLAGYETPGVESFDVPPIIKGVPWFDRPMLMAMISVVIIPAFWLWMARKNALVPSKSQFLGESAYNFVRNGIVRDQIGGRDFKRFVPYLLALICFILVNNVWEVFPAFVFPTIGRVGWAYGLAIMSWVVYNAVGIGRHGPLGYLRRSVLPAGVPVALWPIVIPLEFASNIVLRPLTLSLRLFGNMFAGHLLILIFVTGGTYLLLDTPSIINNIAGGISLIFSMLIFALELFVAAFQAYVFALLTAQYIGSSLADEH